MPKTGGYSGKPLSEKLGLKPGLVVAVIGAPSDYRRLIGNIPAGVMFVPREGKDLDFVHVFVRERSALRRQLSNLRSRIRPNGMIWVSWPKNASGMPTDLTDDVVRAEALAHGLVDVKVCAVDATWSGLKLVIRTKDRG